MHTSAHASHGLDRRVAAALAIIYVAWGSTYLAIRVMVESVPPLLGTSVRFLAASLLVAGFVGLRARRAGFAARPAELAGASLIGILLLGVGTGSVGIAEEHVDSGLAALVFASVPLWVVLLALARGRLPGRATLAGVAVGFAGVALLVAPGGGGSGPAWAFGLLIVAAVATAVGSVLSPRVPQPRDVVLATAVQMGAAGLAVVPMAVALGEPGELDVGAISGRSLLALLYLVVVGSIVAFSAFVWLLAHAPVATVSTYAYVNPVIAVVLGWLILDEHLSARVLVAALVIVASVAAIVRRPAPG